MRFAKIINTKVGDKFTVIRDCMVGIAHFKINDVLEAVGSIDKLGMNYKCTSSKITGGIAWDKDNHRIRHSYKNENTG